jgi:hypothetical protein
MRNLLFAASLILACGLAVPQSPDKKPVESAHVAGPHGLEAWTIDSPIPDDSNHETYPFTLVVARKGKVFHKIQGDPFVWRWIFWDDGRQIAYESGPLHFVMMCELCDLNTGRVLDSIEGYQGVAANPPAWLVALEKSH